LVGLVLIVTGAFQDRMQGDTRIGTDGFQTTLAPDVTVTGHAADARSRGGGTAEQDDPSTVSARPPTLEAALGSIPLTWTKERICHDDGQEHVHVKSPQGGFDVVINVAALDSPAPPWLLAAINAMETAERD
jgi:hypothetical protein